MSRDVHLPVYPGEWRRVCAAGDVPINGMKAFVVDGVSVLVVDTGDARVAVEATCPHEAVPLDRGVLDGATLTCLEHMWQFDVCTGAPLGEAEECLKTYRLKEEDGDVYVAF
jgi:toluene monooxygenase system ferredoxin subunit